ncbi:MAG TPA: prepilin-type N-terminal cleavage/methylation domain-containing protein [Geobacteraceae bacterium]|nr:prepilin-type N-terminal cleavage/methylation domain-containing protein [Geobacteraceae bacterium]
MKGFTLLEVLVALAIMSGVILTTIVSFNYHLGIVIRDKDESAAILLARGKIDDPGFSLLPAGKGNFAPQRPDMAWEKSFLPTKIPGVAKMVFTISWEKERRKLALVRYVAKT